VYLYPQDQSVIDGYTFASLGTFVVHCGALPWYPSVDSYLKYDRFWSIVLLFDLSVTETMGKPFLWCCSASAVPPYLFTTLSTTTMLVLTASTDELS